MFVDMNFTAKYPKQKFFVVIIFHFLASSLFLYVKAFPCKRNFFDFDYNKILRFAILKQLNNLYLMAVIFTRSYSEKL